MLINVPIESLVDRYSAQWNAMFPREFERLGVEFTTIYPEGQFESSVVSGEFLNVVSTNRFKAQQLSMICSLFEAGKINDDTVFFFHDLWFPGLEMLFYIRDGLGMKFKITGMIHAGSYDPHDFLARRGMRRWASAIERSWLAEVDTVFVATHFHYDLLKNSLGHSCDNVVVSGFPLPELDFPEVQKENIVVFPHRLAPEKNPDVFDLIAHLAGKELPGWQFIKSKDVCKTKDEYYHLLARSKIAVSCASQETWGIAQQEAMFAGCLPVVPDHLSYSEMYKVGKYAKSEGTAFTLQDVRSAVELVVRSAKTYDYVVQNTRGFDLNLNRRALQHSCKQAISNMLGWIMRSTGNEQ